MTTGDQNGVKSFAVALHGRDGVAAACQALQDRAGVDVNVLLAAAWLGATRGVALGSADVATLDAHVRSWRHDVVQPLRAVRRRLKFGPHPAPSEATARLRAQLQSVEIEAELVELDEIEAFFQRSPAAAVDGSATTAEEGMLDVVRHFSGREPDDEDIAALRAIASAAAAL